MGTGLWMILAYSLFRDDRRIPRWMIAAIAAQAPAQCDQRLRLRGSRQQRPAITRRIQPSSTSSSARCRWRCSPPLRFSRSTGPPADGERTWTSADACFACCSSSSSAASRSASTRTELYLLDASYSSRAPFDNVITLVMAVGYVSVALTVLRFDHRVLERLVERTSPLPDPQIDVSLDRDFAALTRALKEEKVYLTPRPLDRRASRNGWPCPSTVCAP